MDYPSLAYRWPPMLYRHLYDRQRKKQTKPRRLFHPHHMLLPRTLRCSQLNLNQQRLACESFPISITFLFVSLSGLQLATKQQT